MELSRALNQLEQIRKMGGKMRLAAEEWDTDWKCLIAILMSAQSRDETTIPIAENLFQRYPTLDDLSNARYEDVLDIFRSLNLNRAKAKNVIACAKELLTRHGGIVPHDISKLVELSGVGRKTANVFMAVQGKEGLGVDTHVYYISRKLGWSSSKDHHKVEDDLKKLFPSKYWAEINPILVRFGKHYTSRKEKEFILEEIKKI